jgi:hypothetical protein
MQVHPKQLAAVISLTGEERYEHFVKVVVDWQQAWGLYQNGWALATADDGTVVFPLWPAKEYAELCAEKEWSRYQPRPIVLEDLVSELLPKLEKDGMLPGVFFTPKSKGTTPAVRQLLTDLRIELDNY